MYSYSRESSIFERLARSHATVTRAQPPVVRRVARRENRRVGIDAREQCAPALRDVHDMGAEAFADEREPRAGATGEAHVAAKAHGRRTIAHSPRTRHRKSPAAADGHTKSGENRRPDVHQPRKTGNTQPATRSSQSSVISSRRDLRGAAPAARRHERAQSIVAGSRPPVVIRGASEMSGFSFHFWSSVQCVVYCVGFSLFPFVPTLDWTYYLLLLLDLTPWLYHRKREANSAIDGASGRRASSPARGLPDMSGRSAFVCQSR